MGRNITELPDNYQLAQKKDFFKPEGTPKFGMKFIMKSFHDDHLEEFELNERFEYKKIEPWVSKARCWVPMVDKKEEEKDEEVDSLMDKIDFMF